MNRHNYNGYDETIVSTLVRHGKIKKDIHLFSKKIRATAEPNDNLVITFDKTLLINFLNVKGTRISNTLAINSAVNTNSFSIDFLYINGDTTLEVAPIIGNPICNAIKISFKGITAPAEVDIHVYGTGYIFNPQGLEWSETTPNPSPTEIDDFNDNDFNKQDFA